MHFSVLVLKKFWTSEFLYALPNIIRVIKCRRMRGAGSVAHVGDMRSAYKIFVRKPEGKNNS
jgi:hypothetical protein